MIIYIGADHRGFEVKKTLKIFLHELGYEIADLGNSTYDENDDYPDFAAAVAERVSHDYENSRGILTCGSGIGVSVVANKFPRIRSALATNADQAFDSRNDDNANVLSLPANHLDIETIKKIVTTWLSTPFSSEERHRRRLQKIHEIETENKNSNQSSSDD